jgi:hypothetical protein
MENVGVMVPFLKVFISWHIIGFCILLITAGVVHKTMKDSKN